jgi:hypothetical protein
MLPLIRHEPSQSERPLFESLDAALRLAYRARPSTLARSRWSRMIVSRGDARRLRNPDLDPMPHGYEAAGLVGEVKRVVEARPPIEQAHLTAKFAPGRVSREAQRVLLPHVSHLLRDGDLAAIVGWMTLRFISRFYGYGRGRLSLLAMNLELPQRAGEKAANHHKRRLRLLKEAERRVHVFLQSLATDAEESVYSALKDKGLVL